MLGLSHVARGGSACWTYTNQRDVNSSCSSWEVLVGDNICDVWVEATGRFAELCSLTNQSYAIIRQDEPNLLCRSSASPVNLLSTNVHYDPSLRPFAPSSFSAALSQLAYIKETSAAHTQLLMAPTGAHVVTDPNTGEAAVLDWIAFHSPTEHTLGSAHADVEVQFFFTHGSLINADADARLFCLLADEYGAMTRSRTRMAVSVLLRASTSATNAAVSVLLEGWRRMGEPVGSASISCEALGSTRNRTNTSSGGCGGVQLRNVQLPRPLKLEELLPPSRDYYFYEGSLTVPPCSGGVSWYVMADPLLISLAQLSAIRQHMELSVPVSVARNASDLISAARSRSTDVMTPLETVSTNSRPTSSKSSSVVVRRYIDTSDECHAASQVPDGVIFMDPPDASDVALTIVFVVAVPNIVVASALVLLCCLSRERQKQLAAESRKESRKGMYAMCVQENDFENEQDKRE